VPSKLNCGDDGDLIDMKHHFLVTYSAERPMLIVKRYGPKLQYLSLKKLAKTFILSLLAKIR